MKKLLWVGDAACPSGFAVATHGILETLRHSFDVTVLGINYFGDPHQYPYPIYAATGIYRDDFFGTKRLVWMCDVVKPDVIVFQNDGWNIPGYIAHLRRVDDYKDVPVVAAVAVDGKNFNGRWLEDVHTSIFWTQFALDEARAGGFPGRAEVIPLGVNLSQYSIMNTHEARLSRGLPKEIDDAFVVGNVNRNQPRKRWDLMLRYFAEWIYGGEPVETRIPAWNRKIKDAYLFFHTAPTGDSSVDINQLARYYSIADRMLVVTPPVFYGLPENEMRLTYNCFDVYASTTQGEGMGLPAMEAMACGRACLLPDSSAYGDWAKGAADLVPCTSTAVGPPYLGVIGAVPDEKMFVAQLDRLYHDQEWRTQVALNGFSRVNEDRFRWTAIGEQWKAVLDAVVAEKVAA